MNGKLFVYDEEKRLTAFQSGDHDNCLVFIGGLTDGFMALKYLNELAVELNKKDIALIQVLLSSSYNQYGTSSLAQDVEDLDKLILYLNKNFKQISLLGHSTGCQDIVKYLKNGEHKNNIHRAILQGPVSDREYMATLEGTQEFLETAKKMIKEGRENDLMPRAAYDVPITAYRFNSLAGHLGDDDMFSSDISEDQFKQIFGHISIPNLWVFSGADQYVPPHVSIPSLSSSIQKSTPKSEVLLLPNERHEIVSPSLFISTVVAFLTQ